LLSRLSDEIVNAADEATRKIRAWGAIERPAAKSDVLRQHIVAERTKGTRVIHSARIEPQ
jgi:hypothetical protein